MTSKTADMTTRARRLVWEPLKNNWGHWLRLLFLSVFCILTLMPLIWVISTSLRTPIESFSVPPEWIPVDMDFSNYAQVFEQIPFAFMIGNSFLITLSVVIGRLVTASLAGYAFARLRFRGRNVLFWIVLATLMIPDQATIIPVFIIIARVFHLADTLWALILPSVPTAFGTFLLRQYFLQIPADYEEAALIDGANQWQIFRRIYLPLASPGLAIVAILTFNSAWNDYFRPLVFMSTRTKYPITMGIVELQGELQTGSISVVLAGIVLSMIPVIAIYILGQRYLIEGLMAGGIRG